MTARIESRPEVVPFRFPAEWERQEAVWVSWPHEKSATFPGESMEWVLPEFVGFVEALARRQRVLVNVRSEAEEQFARRLLSAESLQRISFFTIRTNEPWCRDYGPIFLFDSDGDRRALCFDFDGWNGQCQPFDDDAAAAEAIADAVGVPAIRCPLVGEGGAIDSNGAGVLLASLECLVNPGRNPDVDRAGVEQLFAEYLGAREVIWTDVVLEGDDTLGHVDIISRFVSEDTVVTALPRDSGHPEYDKLAANAQRIGQRKLGDGRPLKVVPVPLPEPFTVQAPGKWVERPAASYVNFVLAEGAVVVPRFGVPEDDVAVGVFQELFPDREVVSLPSRRLVWGLGSFHCLTQPVPHQPST